jgi:uncharacterized membrane protein
MEFFFTILLIIHITAGTIGLFTGTINIIRKKGDKLHKSVGRFFYFGMLINGFAGFIMSLIHINYFLLIIAVFSIYMISTGQRSLSLKQLNKGQKPQVIDWILSIIMSIFGTGFIIFGGYLVFTKVYFGTVMLVFGLISILMVLQDIKNYQGKIEIKNFWLLVHIQRMIGAYIAATTAFLVVNNTILPGIVAWLLPTVILVPLIFIWTRKHKSV